MAESIPQWWDESTVAVVTGANKGIGFEIARSLADKGLSVVVTSRDESRGKEALQKLQSLVPAGKFEYEQLDITDPASVAACSKAVKDKFGEVTVLINNAGMAYKGNAFGADEAAETIACNLKGTRNVCESMGPLLSSRGRIVNVCSESGHLKQLKSEDLKQRFAEAKSADDVEAVAGEFVTSIRDDSYAAKGWSKSMYGISKLSEIAYTFCLARELRDKGVMVNAVCPGWCKTDMSSNSGPGTAATGADTPVWIALRDPESFETEKFFSGRHEIVW